ncbi:MAG: prepilin-type N-terminal cleavage/methylation domain-containing protein [Verrucomicrobiia bacterium]|jgi:prepilin-type N-terminal cleavage/methylation domain-containing protein
MKPCQNTKAAFTLIELLASMTILGVMTFLLFSAFDQTSKAWLQGESRVETYSSARAALDYMSRELAQAMVNSNSFQFFGTTNSVAFIAPSDDRAGDPVDMAEVVYRLSQPPPLVLNPSPLYPSNPFTNTAPPYKLIRRSSVYSTVANNDCWDFGKDTPCSGGLNAAWDFYYPTPPPATRNWMETSQTNRVGVLAENIMSLTFQYVSAVTNFQFSYWNSTNVANIWNNELPNGGIPYRVNLNGTDDPLYMTNHAPAGVIIQIGVVDNRTAIKLANLGTTSGPIWNTTTNQGTKFFTTFVEIPNQ